MPQTLAGSIIHKMVSQKMFAPEIIETLSKAGEPEPKAPSQTPAKVDGSRPKKERRVKLEEPAPVEQELRSEEVSEEQDSEEES